MTIGSNQANHDWQAECLRDIQQAITDGEKDFLVEACPGAGKTRLSLRVIANALKDDRCGIVIIVVPSRHLKQQWCDAARKQGVELSGKLSNENLANGIPGDVCGYVVTYAAVANWPELHQMLCASRRALVVLDEIHHAGDAKQWGEGLRTGFEDAVFRLALSGTPFRSDNQPIPFVAYDDEGMSKADYVYTYGRAIGDKVCRPMVFPTWKGEVEWSVGGLEQAAKFDDELDEQSQSYRLRAALAATGELVPDMIGHAHERLKSLRANGHPKAAGLLIADSMAHARALAGVMRRKIGVDPIVAVSDDAEAGHHIKAFTTGSDPWLIAVKMVSEGVDIPRLRVGVYATCTVAPLFFAQVVGRFVRMQRGLREQTSYLYFPADRRLLEQARAIHESVKIGLEDREKREMTEREEKEISESLFVPISASGSEGAHIVGGSDIDLEYILRAREVQSRVSGAAGMPEAVIADILKQGLMFGDIQAENNTEELVDYDTRVKRIKDKINKYVNRIAHRTYGYGNGGQNEVHTKLNKAAGIAHKENPTAAKLERKAELAREWFRGIAQRGAA